MGKLFEIVMLLCFCFALAVMEFRFAKGKSTKPTLERLTVITMGVGFLIGAIAKAITSPADWIIVLYIFGIHQSYTATVFSVQSEKTDGNLK